MKIQKQPDYLIFADSAKKGENAEFPDISRGWGVTIEQTASKPPMEWMNGAFNRVDKNMLYLLQQGVPEWNEKVTYPANAIIKYNGVLYTAIAENDNTKPSANTTKWKKTQAEIPTASTTQKGIVQLSSATNSTSETEAATSLSVKKTYERANTANANAISANSNANNAHSKIDASNKILSNLTDRIGMTNYETALFSADKNNRFVVRNDGIAGVYSEQTKSFLWNFDINGFIKGYISATRVDGLDQFVRDRSVPVGVPMPWPQGVPPTGYFECNGSPFNKNNHPKLAYAYPSGFLPDLRGEFIRGWDNGRGTDPGRGILSWQNCEIQQHSHGQNIRVFSEGGTGNPWGSGGDNFETDYWFNTGKAGGNETRPRNVAFMYIVKAE